MIRFCPYKNGDRLLDLLAASSDAAPLSIDRLIERLGLARRSVLYLMKNVNASLAAHGIPAIANRKGRGYYLTDAARAASVR